MIVETRYRDIPFETVAKCMTEEGRAMVDTDLRSWEKNGRGKPVRINVPAVTTPQWQYVKCDGPFFEVAGREGEAMVCPHIAEIGD